ncbi:DUF7221 family queuine tRNA-ribosyltransferase-like protein [Bradyrhizobium liaoningense]|uniref:deazapurine DNA modification protein DpdA family protein n=1 Tax=Bradyrhizobium liaoningense TaxID=43992 RepID=UPI001BA67A55|nr:hypothetical protein [Bradyrhizobium liaoningense]MBR1170519.1 hypothetical protein [Bradyrhizobium liaoningense]
MRFFVGLHQPSDAKHIDRAFISVNRVRSRKKQIGAGSWIMDSGAFTEIATYGRYRSTVEDYAAEINRWAIADSGLIAAVSQDYMCEPFIVAKTGLSVEAHQWLTIERYDALLPLVKNVYLMPVLQGYFPSDYVRHLGMYGDRLAAGAWVGVGSVCKRNTNVATIEHVLSAIKSARPDLRLHAFGLKITALASAVVRDLLYTADSMAWSFAARRQGRNANDWREAAAFSRLIDTMPVQTGWCL